MELGKAKALRVLNDHDGGVGHVHPHLDDGGGHQNVRLSGGKGGHDGVLLPGLHLAVDEGYPQVREYLRLEHFGVGGDGLPLVGQLVVLLHHRADDIGLPPLRRQLAEKLVHPGVVAAGDGVGLNGLAAGGQLVDDGHVQVPVQNEGQGPGNGGGGHDQGVGMAALGRQSRPLSNAEAVLLVGDHQAQVPEVHPLRQKGVGADDKVRLSRRQAGGNGPLFPGGGGAGQQGAPDAKRLQQGGEAPVVLLGQDLRGGHQGRLPAVLHHKVHAGGGHHGLAGAHVPLAQAVHGDAPLHVGQGLVHAAALGVRQGEGEGTVKPVHIHGAAGLHLHHLSPPAQPLQSDGEQKQLLKGQPPPGQVQRLGTLRKVDVLVGVADAAQVVLPPDLVRQGVRQNVGALVQPLADGPGQHQLAHPCRQGVDGHDAARHLPAALRLHHRGGHGPAQKVPLRLSVKIIGLPLAEVVFQPGLVEKRHVQHAGLVHGPDLDEVHALSDVGDGGG